MENSPHTSVHSIASLTCQAVDLFFALPVTRTSRLVVPRARLSTVASRAFPVVSRYDVM